MLKMNSDYLRSLTRPLATRVLVFSQTHPKYAVLMA